MKKSKNKGFLSKFGEILVKALPIGYQNSWRCRHHCTHIGFWWNFPTQHRLHSSHYSAYYPSTIIEFGLGIIFRIGSGFIDDHFKKISSKLKSTKA